MLLRFTKEIHLVKSACKVGVVILLAFVLLWNFSMGLANKLV